MRTHLFACIGGIISYMFALILPDLIHRLKINIYHAIFSNHFLWLCFFFVFPILYFQITSEVSSLTIALNYFKLDYTSYLTLIKPFGSGVLDYSISNLNSFYSELILRNEIGFVRMFFELGWIPAFTLLSYAFLIILRAVPTNRPVLISTLVYVSLGLLHHVTIFTPVCSLYLAFFLITSPLHLFSRPRLTPINFFNFLTSVFFLIPRDHIIFVAFHLHFPLLNSYAYSLHFDL